MTRRETSPRGLARAGRRRQAGSSLLLVIWATAMMGFAVMGLVAFVSDELDSGTLEAKRFRARLVAESALAIAGHPGVGRGDPLLRQQVAPAVSYEVVRATEGDRFAINQLPGNPQLAEAVARLFELWGFDAQAARSLVEALSDWVDGDDEARDYGAEREVYLALGREDFPWNRPFRSLEEVLQVRGMAEVDRRVPGWRDSFTVHGDGTVDVNTAGAGVAAALFDVTPEVAWRFVKERFGPDGVERTWDDTPYESLTSVRESLDIDAESFGAVVPLVTLAHPVRRTECTAVVGDLVFLMVRRQGGGVDSTEESWWTEAATTGGGGVPGAAR